jgi:hypothetical protein
MMLFPDMFLPRECSDEIADRETSRQSATKAPRGMSTKERERFAKRKRMENATHLTSLCAGGAPLRSDRLCSARKCLTVCG